MSISHFYLKHFFCASVILCVNSKSNAQKLNQDSSNVAESDQETLDSFQMKTPKGLEKDVLFWEKVFSEYTPDQCIFHDEWNLDVIYEVSSVPVVRSGGRNFKLKSKLQKIRLALKNIAKSGVPDSQFERKIFAAIPSHLRHKSFFTEAGQQVRCQRGVDFQESLLKSQKYLNKIKEILREKNLPEDLAYLPHLESGFNVKALSRAGARGLWQFMPATAKSEGLRISKKDDWRIDPVKSTEAATDYLGSLYLRVQSWELAVTSYNYGPNGILRAVKKYGPDYMKIRSEHKSKIFGFAARNYYPSFLAVRNIANRAERQVSRETREYETIVSENL